VDIHLTGLRNILVHLGMMPGMVVNTAKRKFLENYVFVRTDLTGLWYPEIKVSQLVNKDQVVGYIRDVFGQHMLDVKSPIEGVVTCIRTSPNIRPGNVIFELGAIASQEV
jgi:predicted deacylase